MVSVTMFQVRVSWSPAHILRMSEPPEAQAFMPATSPRAAAIKALSLVADSHGLTAARFAVAAISLEHEPVMFSADLRPGSREFLAEVDPHAPWDEEASQQASGSVASKGEDEGLSFVPIDDLPPAIKSMISRLGDAVEGYIDNLEEQKKKRDN